MSFGATEAGAGPRFGGGRSPRNSTPRSSNGTINPFAGWSDTGKGDNSAECSTQAPGGLLTPGGRSLTPVRSGNTTPGGRTPRNSQGSDALNSYTAHWEADSSHCFRCEKAFNRAKMINRHHCRTCGKNVCGKCSPSSLQLDGTAPQRVCTTCASVAGEAPKLKERVLTLSQQLYVIHDAQAVQAEGQAQTLDEAIAFCEGAVLPLKVSQTRTYRSLEDLGRRMNNAAEIDNLEPPPGRSMEAIVNFCEAASEALEDHLTAKLQELERERARADDLEESLRVANQKVEDARAALTERASFRRTISQNIASPVVQSLTTGSVEASPQACFGSDPAMPTAAAVAVPRRSRGRGRQEGKTCVNNDKCSVM